jgi:hypothetical protein
LSLSQCVSPEPFRSQKYNFVLTKTSHNVALQHTLLNRNVFTTEYPGILNVKLPAEFMLPGITFFSLLGSKHIIEEFQMMKYNRKPGVYFRVSLQPNW